MKVEIKPTDTFRFRDYPFRWPFVLILWHLGHVMGMFGNYLTERT